MKDVKLFGASGNGTADDSDAIQSALDANPNSYIVFPEGIYLFDRSIVFESSGGEPVAVILEPDAILKPATGVTINSNGQLVIEDNDRSRHFDYPRNPVDNALEGQVINMTLARPEWFGGLPNSGDTRQAFEDAEASLLTNGEIRLGHGQYVFFGGTHPIISTKALKISGINPLATTIVISAPDNIEPECWFWQFLLSGENPARGFTIRDLSIRCGKHTTNGYLIDVTNSTGKNQAADGLIENVHWRSTGRVFGGIRIRDLVQGITIQNIQGNSSKNFLIFENCYNIFVKDFRGDGSNADPESVGIRLVGLDKGSNVEAEGGIEALHFVDGMLTNFGTTMKVRGTDSVRWKNVSACKFERIYFDDSKRDDNVQLWNMTNSWFSHCYMVSAERYGCLMQNCHTLHFSNCQFDHNFFRGVRVDNDCTGIFFNGGSAADNGWGANAGKGCGIWIEGFTKNFQIIGMDCRGMRPEDKGGYEKPQGTGIHIGAGCDHFIVSNNTVTGNVGANIENLAGIDQTKIVTNNLE